MARTRRGPDSVPRKKRGAPPGEVTSLAPLPQAPVASTGTFALYERRTGGIARLLLYCKRTGGLIWSVQTKDCAYVTISAERSPVECLRRQGGRYGVSVHLLAPEEVAILKEVYGA